MKNPFKRLPPTAPIFSEEDPPWSIHIEPVSSTEIRSNHNGIALREALGILQAIVRDYENQLSKEGHEHA
jgi:hypothetical protein